MAWVCANGGVVAGRALVASGAECPAVDKSISKKMPFTGNNGT